MDASLEKVSPAALRKHSRQAPQSRTGRPSPLCKSCRSRRGAQIPLESAEQRRQQALTWSSGASHQMNEADGRLLAFLEQCSEVLGRKHSTRTLKSSKKEVMGLPVVASHVIDIRAIRRPQPRLHPQRRPYPLPQALMLPTITLTIAATLTSVAVMTNEWRLSSKVARRPTCMLSLIHI